MRSFEQKTIRGKVVGCAMALALATAAAQPAFGRDDHETHVHPQSVPAKSRLAQRPPSAAAIHAPSARTGDKSPNPRSEGAPGGDQGKSRPQPNPETPPPVDAVAQTLPPVDSPPPHAAPVGMQPMDVNGPVQAHDMSPATDRAAATATRSAPSLIPVGLLALAIGSCAWTLLRRRRRVGAPTTVDRLHASPPDGGPVVVQQTTADPSVDGLAARSQPMTHAIEHRQLKTTSPTTRAEAIDVDPRARVMVLEGLQGEPSPTSALAGSGLSPSIPDPDPSVSHHPEPEPAHPAWQIASEVIAHAPELGSVPPSASHERVDAGPSPATNPIEPPNGDAGASRPAVAEEGCDEASLAAPTTALEVPYVAVAAIEAAPTPRAVPTASPSTASLAQETSSILRRLVGDFGRDLEKRTAIEPAIARGTPVESGQATWFPAGAHVGVAGASILGGFVYVGSRLPSSSNSSEPDNCLVDPRLTVARRADVVQPLPYWPSYARITPGWRRAYIDFLAGSRSDPSTPIGLVFLYFYGLERRALIDRATSELDAITSEVRRLATIYGANQSFRHYADELLAAMDILREGDGWTPSFEPAATVPIRQRVALGRHAAEGRPIDPELLLSVTMTHPETRVRTPARRALPILRKVFATKLAEAYPSGLVVKRVKTMKALSLPYRAASSSFTVDVHPPGDKVPDVLARDEPLATGRRLLDACTDELDAFSRELGKLAGASPTLAVVARLPISARREAADALPDAPLVSLDRMCAEGPVELPALQRLLGLPAIAKATRARTSEVAVVLARFGFGLVPDPTYTMRVGKAVGSVIVFALGRAKDEISPCSDAYRSAHLALVLGVMVALADGHVDAREREALLAIGRQSAGLSPDETRRLVADLAWLESSPALLGDLKTHLSGLSPDIKRHLLDVAVGISMADDVITTREVSILERISRQLGLDPTIVYSRLHGAHRAPTPHPDDDLPEVIAPSERRPVTAPLSIAGAPRPDVGLDLGRLAAIRTETMGISTLLGEIFAEDEEVSTPVVAEPAPATTRGHDGLDAKHSALLETLSTREEWTSADFERLVRGSGLMPGAARDVLNDWSLDRHDELVLEGDDPVVVNVHLVMEGV